MMECFVYVLGSCGLDGYRTYVGWTNDLERRIARHNAGTGARSTRGRVWFLLYAERHDSREEAMSREWHLKRNRTFRKTLTQSGYSARDRFDPPKSARTESARNFRHRSIG